MKIVLCIRYGWVLYISIKLITKVSHKNILGVAKSQKLKVCTSFAYT